MCLVVLGRLVAMAAPCVGVNWARWVGLSALWSYFLMPPGAMPQAGIERAFGLDWFVVGAVAMRDRVGRFWRTRFSVFLFSKYTLRFYMLRCICRSHRHVDLIQI